MNPEIRDAILTLARQFFDNIEIDDDGIATVVICDGADDETVECDAITLLGDVADMMDAQQGSMVRFR